MHLKLIALEFLRRAVGLKEKKKSALDLGLQTLFVLLSGNVCDHFGHLILMEDVLNCVGFNSGS